MFNVGIYEFNIEIDMFQEGDLVAKATWNNCGYMEINVDQVSKCFDLFGVSQMAIDFMDDDYIIFKKWKGGDHVTITISKHGKAGTVGKMLEYLAGISSSLC